MIAYVIISLTTTEECIWEYELCTWNNTIYLSPSWLRWTQMWRWYWPLYGLGELECPCRTQATASDWWGFLAERGWAGWKSQHTPPDSVPTNLAIPPHGSPWAGSPWAGSPVALDCCQESGSEVAEWHECHKHTWNVQFIWIIGLFETRIGHNTSIVSKIAQCQFLSVVHGHVYTAHITTQKW